MNDAFNNQTPVIAEESQKGDGWHIYNARGDRIAAIIGSSAEDVAKTAARAINDAATGEGATEVPLTTEPAVATASTFPFRRLTAWDWYAGQAVLALVQSAESKGDSLDLREEIAGDAGRMADAMMAERAKRGIV